MKTPKRTMTKDHVEIERYIRGVNCQYNAMKARWKRKNREARLRHRIERLEEHILWQRQKAQEILEHVQNNVEPFLDSIGTCGQDIEGS